MAFNIIHNQITYTSNNFVINGANTYQVFNVLGNNDGIGIQSSSGYAGLMMRGASENRIYGIGAVPLTFYTNNVEAARFDTNGYFMLGQTAAYSVSGGGYTIGTFTLTANSRTNFAISNQSSGTLGAAALVLASYGYDWIISNGSIANNSTSLTFSAGTNERVRFTTGGLVGIGTNSPATALDIIATGGSGVNSQNAATIHVRPTVQNSYAALELNTLNGGTYGGAGLMAVNSVNYDAGLLFFYTPASSTTRTEGMRLDYTGNVYIGATSSSTGWPAAKIYIKQNGSGTWSGVTAVASSNDAGIGMWHDGSYGNIGVSYGTSAGYTPLRFTVGNSTAATIDANGSFCIKTTAAYSTGGGLTGSISNVGAVSTNPSPIVMGPYSTSTGLPHFVGNWASSGTWGIGPDTNANDSRVRIGIVNSTVGGGASWSGTYANIVGASFPIGSDYRLKENVVDYTETALDKILSLRIVKYNLIRHHDPSEGKSEPIKNTELGLIAHEAQEHIPEIVWGGKDALDSHGNPQYQTVDYDRLTVVLTKAVQELTAKLKAAGVAGF